MNNTNNILKTISKTLSANDTGETGGHQAGILVPKQKEILSFFPEVNKNEKNPRIKLIFKDGSGVSWTFIFIYYNNKFFGGTRNEYRLTHMTRYFRSNNLKAGDEILLHLDIDGIRSIRYKRTENTSTNKILKLSNSWKVVNI